MGCSGSYHEPEKLIQLEWIAAVNALFPWIHCLCLNSLFLLESVYKHQNETEKNNNKIK